MAMHTRAQCAKQRRTFESIELGATACDLGELFMRGHPLAHYPSRSNSLYLQNPHRAGSLHREF
jgi:hypothetical protein